MLLFEDRRLVGELMRRKSRCMLSLHSKGVLVGEVMGAKRVRVEAMELGGRHCLSGVQSTLRGG